MTGTTGAVRIAARDWLTDAVPGLTAVRLAKPQQWPSGNDWTFPKDAYGGLSCAAGYVYVENGESGVTSISQGRGGARADVVTVTTMLLFKSRSRDAEESIQHLDEIIDGIVARIASDPTWGGRVWSAAQRTLSWDIDLQQKEGGTYTVWAQVTCDVETPTVTTGLL